MCRQGSVQTLQDPAGYSELSGKASLRRDRGSWLEAERCIGQRGVSESVKRLVLACVLRAWLLRRGAGYSTKIPDCTLRII